MCVWGGGQFGWMGEFTAWWDIFARFKVCDFCNLAEIVKFHIVIRSSLNGTRPPLDENGKFIPRNINKITKFSCYTACMCFCVCACLLLCSTVQFLGSVGVQWNLSIKDTLNRGHLSNEDTVCRPNHTKLCTSQLLN